MLTFLAIAAVIGGFIADKNQRLQGFLFGAAFGMVLTALLFFKH
jgi:hypothetical protein